MLSAWSGIRPLAVDPHVASDDPSSGASRDHIISHNPKTGVVFVSGGKWTTYREMAEDAVDKVVQVGQLQTTRKCSTLSTALIGRDGYTDNLPIKLAQEYGINWHVATRLARAYGGLAREVSE